jgi:hypothetical protein
VLQQLAELLSDNGGLLGGDDPQTKRVLDAIRRALGEQGQKDTPPTPADDKVMVGKAEELTKSIEQQAERLGGRTPSKAQRARRAQQSQRQADERLDLARQLVDLDRQLRHVARSNPAGLGPLQARRAQVARSLENLLVDQVLDDAAQRAEDAGRPRPAQDVEEQIRDRAAGRLVAQLTNQLRGPRPADPHQLARLAERLKDEVVDAARTAGLFDQVPETLVELSTDLVRLNRRQAEIRSRVQNPTAEQSRALLAEAAALEPDRQAVLAQMHDLLTGPDAQAAPGAEPPGDAAGCRARAGQGPAGEDPSVDRGADALPAARARPAAAEARPRAPALARPRGDQRRHRAAEGRSRRRPADLPGADIKDELADVEVLVRGLGTAGQQRAQTLREGLMRANLLRGHDLKDEERYRSLRAAQALVDPSKPETVGDFLRTLRDPGLLDYVQEAGVANLLTSPRTWFMTGANVVGNLANIAGYAMVETPLVGGLAETRMLWGGMLGAKGEAYDQLKQIMAKGYVDADVDRALMTSDWAQHRPELLGSVPYIGPLYDKGLYLISTRPLNAVDAFAGHMLFMGAIRQLALRRARALLEMNPRGYRVPSAFGEDEVAYTAEPDGSGRYRSQQRYTLITDEQELARWGLRHLSHPEWADIKDEAGHIEDYSLLRRPLDRKGRGGEAAIDRVIAGLSALGMPTATRRSGARRSPSARTCWCRSCTSRTTPRSSRSP